MATISKVEVRFLGLYKTIKAARAITNTAVVVAKAATTAAVADRVVVTTTRISSSTNDLDGRCGAGISIFKDVIRDTISDE